MNKKLSSTSVADLEKRERLKRAKNKIQLMRRQVNDKKANKHKLLALVREYVSQRPEVAIQVVQKWIDEKP